MYLTKSNGSAEIVAMNSTHIKPEQGEKVKFDHIPDMQ